MTTWGASSFENESADVFTREVVEDGVYALQEAFAVVLDPDLEYVELVEGQRAVAAVEVLAAVLSGQVAALPNADLRVWADAQAPAELIPLRELAREALQRVLAPDSELPDFWEESAQAPQWRADIQRLRDALG